MVHGMTEQSGGRFVLKSRPGEGTAAEIWLPVAKLAKPAESERFVKDGAAAHPGLWLYSPSTTTVWC